MAEPPLERRDRGAKRLPAGLRGGMGRAEGSRSAQLSLPRLLGLDRSGPSPAETRGDQPLRPWTIPNAIGFLRLALIPVFLAVALSSSDGTGALSATLFASTSGTDADFVVKLIDVYPDSAQKNAWDADFGPGPNAYARSLNGYELPIAISCTANGASAFGQDIPCSSANCSTAAATIRAGPIP